MNIKINGKSIELPEDYDDMTVANAEEIFGQIVEEVSQDANKVHIIECDHVTEIDDDGLPTTTSHWIEIKQADEPWMEDYLMITLYPKYSRDVCTVINHNWVVKKKVVYWK